MQLKPKLPPGRANRKALRYGHEVRRLRADGHTLESIREALLDVGVAVSLSTVRREANRPPSKWEMEHADERPLALPTLVELTPTAAAPDTPAWPRRSGTATGQATGLATPKSDSPNSEKVGARRGLGMVAKVLTALRRPRRAQQAA